MNKILTSGQKAKNISLLNQSNELVSTETLKGKWIVLYFYPRDNTPGCTIEAIDFSKLKPEFDQLDAVILGVSPDSIKKHCNFIEKKDLTITLLSDPEHELIESYGAWQLKKFMGREAMGVVRSTWLIDPQGVICESWSPVKVKNHAQIVLEKLKEQI